MAVAGFGVMQGNELFDAKPNFNTVAGLCYLQASTYPFSSSWLAGMDGERSRKRLALLTEGIL